MSWYTDAPPGPAELAAVDPATAPATDPATAPLTTAATTPATTEDVATACAASSGERIGAGIKPEKHNAPPHPGSDVGHARQILAPVAF